MSGNLGVRHSAVGCGASGVCWNRVRRQRRNAGARGEDENGIERRFDKSPQNGSGRAVCRCYVGVGRCYVRLCCRFSRANLAGAWVFQPDAATAKARLTSGHYVGPLGHQAFEVHKIGARRGVRASRCHH